MKLALAQINPCVGDLEGNVDLCLAAIESARLEGAELVVLPEMAVPGCPPRDILFDPSFIRAVSEATQDLARRAQDGPLTVVGTLMPADRHPPGHPGLHNAAVLLDRGEVQLAAAKRLLPVHDIFYEPRWFLPGPASPPLEVAGKRVGFLVSHDLYDEGHKIHPSAELLAADAELLICIAASPYHRQVDDHRLYHARRHQCSVIYLNLCGGNDELIYDGRSFALDKKGNLIARLASFEEQFQVIDLQGDPPSMIREEKPDEEIFKALVLGVRDFANKNRLEHAVLGLSGGVDSAVVGVIASDALGAEHVTGVAIPSRYTDPRSTTCAQELSQALGIQFKMVDLEPMHVASEASLGDLLEGGTTAENIQARLRAMVLMSFVNRFGGLLLNTSNKTELALGYGTLYGDLAGTLCPIGDLTKPEVIALARWIDSVRGVMPEFTLERPPSAELRPDQVDPFDYAKVAPALERLVQENRSDQALRRSEHKRGHMGVILKVSQKSFGSGRMIPITRR